MQHPTSEVQLYLLRYSSAMRLMACAVTLVLVPSAALARTLISSGAAAWPCPARSQPRCALVKGRVRAGSGSKSPSGSGWFSQVTVRVRVVQRGLPERALHGDPKQSEPSTVANKLSLPVPGHGLSHAPGFGCGAAAGAAAPSAQLAGEDGGVG